MHLETEQTWSEELGLCITTPGTYFLFTFPAPFLPLIVTFASAL